LNNPSCLVLLVISCESKPQTPLEINETNCFQIADFENQGAGRLVLKDAELRARTVGTSCTRFLFVAHTYDPYH